MKIDNGIGRYLQGVMDRSRTTQGWLNRVAFKMIINFQIKRWETEGASEGVKWLPLNPSYKKSKLKRFADYPGAGRKMLVATGRLLDSMTFRTTGESYKLATNTKLEMGSFVPYGSDVDEVRDITTLGDESVEEIVDGLLDYLMGA